MSPKSPMRTVGRRTLLATGAATLLSGCAGSLLGNAVTAARLAYSGIPDAPVTGDYVANLPYASIGARIGRGQRPLLILGSYDGPDRHWVSADHAVLVTRNGRLVRVFGIDRDLRDTHGIETDPIAAQTYSYEGTYHRSVDLGPQQYFGLQIQSTFTVVDRGDIGILDRRHDVLFVREQCSAPTHRWNFENEFYLDFEIGRAHV